MNASFSMDTSELEETIDRLERGLSDCTTGPMADAFDASGRVYLKAMQARFDSEGDGDWAELTPATIKEREREGYSGPHLILTRSGKLRDGLTPGAEGNLFQPRADGIDVGYGGDSKVAVIADAQHNGNDRLPARPILVDPDAATVEAMTQPIEDGVQRLIDGG